MQKGAKESLTRATNKFCKSLIDELLLIDLIAITNKTGKLHG